MLNFECDYATGCHPDILRRLVETNMTPAPGYGEDEWTQSAREKVRKACGGDTGLAIEFLSGGTCANQLVIASVLKPYEGVIAANTGHISVHEAGAIELTGHKVLAMESRDAKLDAGAVEKRIFGFYSDPSYRQMVFPGMVYISNSTEYGTVYCRSELEELHEVCRKRGIPLFMDGARLGYALSSGAADYTLEELPSLCDIFYIGGTKIGALEGEAVVFGKKFAPENIYTLKRMTGRLPAKGRLVGISFDALFTDGLYFRISENAIEMARRLRAVLEKHGLKFFIASPTNQQFVIMDNADIERLGKRMRLSLWDKVDEDHTVVRFVTCWSTVAEDVEELDALLGSVLR